MENINIPRQARSNNDSVEAKNESKIDIPDIIVVVRPMTVKNVLLYEGHFKFYFVQFR